MATARAAINTLLQVGNGSSPEAWTTVANVSSISGPGFSSQVEDVTTHSNANPWREKIPTLLDAGELSFEVFVHPWQSSRPAYPAQSSARVRRVCKPLNITQKGMRRCWLGCVHTGCTSKKYADCP